MTRLLINADGSLA